MVIGNCVGVGEFGELENWVAVGADVVCVGADVVAHATNNRQYAIRNICFIEQKYNEDMLNFQT